MALALAMLVCNFQAGTLNRHWAAQCCRRPHITDRCTDRPLYDPRMRLPEARR